MLQIDKPFPDFSLDVYFPEKDEKGKVTLGDLKGKWLVLFFYPADFTFVCPTELADMQARYEEFKKHGAEVMSVSADTVYTHKGWIEKEELLAGVRFPMAADHNADLGKKCDIYDAETGMSGRGAFIIDPKGILRAIDIVSDNIGRSAGEILRKLKALVFIEEHPGKVCPASWDEGDKTLTPSIKIAGKVKAEL
jgi:peroxiredoxin (alkyl hydroperoxide reductase subunit C)